MQNKTKPEKQAKMFVTIILKISYIQLVNISFTKLSDKTTLSNKQKDLKFRMRGQFCRHSSKSIRSNILNLVEDALQGITQNRAQLI